MPHYEPRNGSARANIFAFGSPYGDDSIGWLLAERLLSAQRPSDDGIRVSQLDRPVLTLTQRLEPEVPTLIIDAMVSGQTVGSLQELTLAQIPDALPQMSSHGYGLLASLQLAKALGRLPSVCLILAIEINPQTKPASPLCQALAQRLTPLSQQIMARARQLARVLESEPYPDN
jgi:hydrogenase maturation protease